MKDLICILLLWIVVAPVLAIVIFLGLEAPDVITKVLCAAMVLFLMADTIKLTRDSWRSYVRNKD